MGMMLRSMPHVPTYLDYRGIKVHAWEDDSSRGAEIDSTLVGRTLVGVRPSRLGKCAKTDSASKGPSRLGQLAEVDSALATRERVGDLASMIPLPHDPFPNGGDGDSSSKPLSVQSTIFGWHKDGLVAKEEISRLKGELATKDALLKEKDVLLEGTSSTGFVCLSLVLGGDLFGHPLKGPLRPSSQVFFVPGGDLFGHPLRFTQTNSGTSFAKKPTSEKKKGETNVVLIEPIFPQTKANTSSYPTQGGPWSAIA
ncbi:hypothetical protein CR513_52881, partial [Mucuna pruriens]